MCAFAVLNPGSLSWIGRRSSVLKKAAGRSAEIGSLLEASNLAIDSVNQPMIAKPHPVDIHVGKRVKLQRTLLGMSQDRLGDLLGVTCQQVLKYERGTNRIGSSRLYKLGQVLNVPVSFFFDDMVGRRLPDTDQDPLQALAEDAEAFRPAMDDIQIMERSETLRLIRAYYQITNLRARKRLFELVISLGRLEADSDVADD